MKAVLSRARFPPRRHYRPTTNGPWIYPLSGSDLQTSASIPQRTPRPLTAPVIDAGGEPLPLWIRLLGLFSIVFIRLTLIITVHTTIIWLIMIMLFLAASNWTMSRRSRERISRGTVVILAAYLLVSGVAMLRGAHAGVYSDTRQALLGWLLVTAMALFFLGLSAGAKNQPDLDTRLKLIIYAPAVYVGTNILLWLCRNHLPFGLPQTTSQAAGAKDELASLLGIQATRVNFPIALGVYNLGTIAAAGFGAAIVLAMRSQRASRRMPIVAAAVCLFGVIATDTRGPLFFALGAIVLFGFWRRVRTSGAVGVFLPLSPLITLTVLGLVAGSGYGNFLSRQDGDVATADNRLFIWHTVFNFLRHPTFLQFVGYGANGQETSHVSDGYAYLFGNSSVDPTVYTTHNIALQTILDSGYLGLIIFVLLVIAGIRCLEHAIRGARGSLTGAVLALFLILVLSGSLEAAPSYLFLDTFVLFAITLAAAAGSLPLQSEKTIHHNRVRRRQRRQLAHCVAVVTSTMTKLTYGSAGETMRVSREPHLLLFHQRRHHDHHHASALSSLRFSYLLRPVRAGTLSSYL